LAGPCDFCRLRVDSGQVRALSEIAAVACERQIIRIVGSAVLLRDDVLHMPPQLAVLQAQPGSIRNARLRDDGQGPCCCVHVLLNHGVEMLASFELSGSR